MTVVSTFGNLPIYGYGLFLSIGTLMSLALWLVLCKKHALPLRACQHFALIVIPLGILMARLVFCLANFSVFIDGYQNPWLMLRFFDGGLSMIGLFPAVLLGAYWVSKINRLSFATLMDTLSAPLALFIGIARLAEQYTDLGIGQIVEEGWVTQTFPALFSVSQMGIATEYRMLVYLYEALACFALCIFLLWQLRKQKASHNGNVSLLFFALYGSFQVLFESMRDDGHMLIIFLRLSQVAAALMPIIVIGILLKRYRRAYPTRILGIVFSWAIVVLCIAGIVLLEFSLDGRLTFGTPSLLRDYAIMVGILFSQLLLIGMLFQTTNTLPNRLPTQI